MEYDRQTSHHKLKTILEALHTDTARQVLNELEQPNPKVKKNLLYELITEISNFTVSEIDHFNNIIQLQQKLILDYKEYAIQLEKQLIMVKSYLNSREAQFQVLIEYPEFGIEMLKKILNEIKIKYDTLVNTNRNDREYLEKIAQQAEKVIKSSVEFTRQANLITQNYKYSEDHVIFEKSLQINRAILLIMKQLESFQKSFAKKYEQIQNNNEVQREKFKEQLIMMKQALGQLANDKIK